MQNNPAQQAASQYILLFRSPKAEPVLSANNFAALADPILTDGLKQGYFSDADCQAYLTAWAQPGALTGGLNWYRAARLGPPTKAEPKARTFESDIAGGQVRVPTLVIWGEKDKAIVKENLDGLETYVSDLRVRRIPDGTHWVIHEQPALVNRHIREFIG